MIEVEININLKKVLEEFSTEKLTKTLNKGIAPKIAVNSSNFIKSGKVGKLEKEPLSGITIRQRKKYFGVSHDKPLLMTGNLANSLKGSERGISSNSAVYGNKSYKKHREGYTWSDRPKNPDYKFAKGSVDVPKREFITALIPSEKSANNKIYKEFLEDFVKLLKPRMRK